MYIYIDHIFIILFDATIKPQFLFLKQSSVLHVQYML